MNLRTVKEVENEWERLKIAEPFRHRSDEHRKDYVTFKLILQWLLHLENTKPMSETMFICGDYDDEWGRAGLMERRVISDRRNQGASDG